MKKYFKRTFTLLLCLGMLTTLAGCQKKEVIKIASKPMTEQYILTEILKTLIEENTDYQVEITKGVGGGTTNIHPALLKGEFDLYPEYTRSAWLNVLKKEEMEKDDQKILGELIAEYEKLGLSWVGFYGFSNTYGIAIRTDMAEEYNISNYSELASQSDRLVFGGNPDYMELPTGYQRLCDAYGMKFADIKQMDISLKYNALINKEVDVINAFTTDAQLAKEELTLLEDDQAFFETFMAGTVVREDSLKKFPKLKAVLEQMEGLLTEEEMQKLNYQVEVEGKEDTKVAREFLIEKGLIES